MSIDLTETDLAEALAIAAAEEIGERHQRPEARHIVALVRWGARCEQEVMAVLPYLDRYDRAAVERQLGRPV